MKRIISLLLVVSILVALSGCKKEKEKEENPIDTISSGDIHEVEPTEELETEEAGKIENYEEFQSEIKPGDKVQNDYGSNFEVNESGNLVSKPNTVINDEGEEITVDTALTGFEGEPAMNSLINIEYDYLLVSGEEYTGKADYVVTSENWEDVRYDIDDKPSKYKGKIFEVYGITEKIDGKNVIIVSKYDTAIVYKAKKEQSIGLDVKAIGTIEPTASGDFVLDTIALYSLG